MNFKDKLGESAEYTKHSLSSIGNFASLAPILQSRRIRQDDPALHPTGFVKPTDARLAGRDSIALDNQAGEA